MRRIPQPAPVRSSRFPGQPAMTRVVTKKNRYLEFFAKLRNKRRAPHSSRRASTYARKLLPLSFSHRIIDNQGECSLPYNKLITNDVPTYARFNLFFTRRRKTMMETCFPGVVRISTCNTKLYKKSFFVYIEKYVAEYSINCVNPPCFSCPRVRC